MTHQATFVLLHFLERVNGWSRRAQAVGYFDEGYAAAQLWKSDWERLGGGELCNRAAALVRAIEPLAT